MAERVGVFQVRLFQAYHIASGDAVGVSEDVHAPNPRASGVGVAQGVERHYADFAVRQAYQPAVDVRARVLAAQQESRRAVAETARVVYVERDGRIRPQLVAHAAVDDGDILAALGESAADFAPERLLKLNVAKPQMPMLIAGHFHARHCRQLVRVESLGDALGDDRQPARLAHHAALEHGGLQNVADLAHADALVWEFLRDDRERGGGGFADAQREMPGGAPHGGDEVPAVGRPKILYEIANQLRAQMPRRFVSEGGHAVRQRQVVVDGLGDVGYPDAVAGAAGHFGGAEGGVVPADGNEARYAKTH